MSKKDEVEIEMDGFLNNGFSVGQIIKTSHWGLCEIISISNDQMVVEQIEDKNE